MKCAITYLVDDFHRKLGLPRQTMPRLVDDKDLAQRRFQMLCEEVRELGAAEQDRDLVGIADALADIIYVAYGTALTYGIDLDAVLLLVHRSNMTKEPGPDHKAVKGPDYQPPDVASEVERQVRVETAFRDMVRLGEEIENGEGNA